MKNKGFWFVFIPYIILFIADIVTTSIIYRFLEHIEMNPLFKFGGLIPIVLLNLFVIWFIHREYHNKKSSPTIRYGYIMFMIIVILFRILAIYNASSWFGAEITVAEVAQAYTPELMKKAQITFFSSIASQFFLPIIIYLFWKLDHIIKRKDQKEEKK